jgi:ferredoxin
MAVTLEWADSDRTETVTPDEGESILEAAEAAGIGLPFGCRTGACATCTGRLLAGSVTHRRPPRALKQRHLEADYVLTCLAVPEGDVRVAVGADHQAEMMGTPWKEK